MISVKYEGRTVLVSMDSGSNLINTPGQQEDELLSKAELDRLDKATDFWADFIPQLFSNRRITFGKAWFDERGPYVVDIVTGLNMEHFPELFRGIKIHAIQISIKEDDSLAKVKVIVGRA